MLLAGELVERPRPHARSERLGLLHVGFVGLAKEIDGLSLPFVILPSSPISPFTDYCGQRLMRLRPPLHLYSGGEGRGEGVQVLCKVQPLTPDPSPPSTVERGAVRCIGLRSGH